MIRNYIAFQKKKTTYFYFNFPIILVIISLREFNLISSIDFDNN